MHPLVIVAVISGLVLAATALGLFWRATTGRITTGGAVAPVDPDFPLGARATLVQFSSEVCSACVPTRTILGGLAAEVDGVRHVELDVAERPDLAARFRVLQTPTTFLLDSTGATRARIGGAPRQSETRAELRRILDDQLTSA